MSYQVTAPLVLAKDPDGQVHHVYEGGVIRWLSDVQATHFVETGLVEKIDDPDDDVEEVEEGPSTKAEWTAYAEELAAELADAGVEVDDPPAKADPKADWVAHAERLEAQRDALAE